MKAEVVPHHTESGAKAALLEGSSLVKIAKLENEKTFYCYANNVIFLLSS